MEGTGGSLGGAIREARIAAGQGLRATARRVGVSASHFFKIETGVVQQPSEEILAAIAVTVGLPLDELLLLSGRVPEDILRCLRGDPSLLAVIRTAANSEETR